MDDVREYEKNMHEQTNIKVCNQHSSTVDDIEGHAQTSVCRLFKARCPPCGKQSWRPTCQPLEMRGPQPSVKTEPLPETVGKGSPLHPVFEWAVSVTWVFQIFPFFSGVTSWLTQDTESGILWGGTCQIARTNHKAA